MDKQKYAKIRSTPDRANYRDASDDSNPSPSFNAADSKAQRIRRQRKNVFNEPE